MRKKINPTKAKLTPDEHEMENSLARGDWEAVSREEHQALGVELKQAALAHVNKEARVNIRMSPQLLEQIKQIAIQEGLPYQTLMGSVLHKFATGRLVDRGAWRASEPMPPKTKTKKTG